MGASFRQLNRLYRDLTMKQFLLGFAVCASMVFVVSALAFPLDTPITDSYSDVDTAELRVFIEAGIVDLVARDSSGVEKGKLRVQKSGGNVTCVLTGHMAEKGTTADCSGIAVATFDSFIAARKTNAETIWQLAGIKKP